MCLERSISQPWTLVTAALFGLVAGLAGCESEPPGGQLRLGLPIVVTIPAAPPTEFQFKASGSGTYTACILETEPEASFKVRYSSLGATGSCSFRGNGSCKLQNISSGDTVTLSITLENLSQVTLKLTVYQGDRDPC